MFKEHHAQHERRGLPSCELITNLTLEHRNTLFVHLGARRRLQVVMATEATLYDIEPARAPIVTAAIAVSSRS